MHLLNLYTCGRCKFRLIAVPRFIGAFQITILVAFSFLFQFASMVIHTYTQSIFTLPISKSLMISAIISFAIEYTLSCDLTEFHWKFQCFLDICKSLAIHNDPIKSCFYFQFFLEKFLVHGLCFGKILISHFSFICPQWKSKFQLK